MKIPAFLLGIVAAISSPASAVDFSVVGPNTLTNGDNNISPITGTDDTLTVESGASITTTGNTVYGIYFNNSLRNIIVNNGLIDTSGNNASGIYNRRSNEAVITNSGQISTSGNNINASGIRNLNSNTAVITNSGQISTSGNNARGIFNRNSNNAVITNSGQISTSGNNAGGIFNQNSNNVTIINSGSIRVNNSNAIGVASNRAISLVNSGLIFAASTSARAIRFIGNRNDTLTLAAGSRIQGRIRMGNSAAGGTDTITLDHNGHDIAWRWTFERFTPAGVDTLVVNGAPFVVQTTGTTTTVTVADLSREATAGAVLADLSGAIRGAVSGRIAQAWALNDAGINSGAAMLDEQGEDLGWNAWAKAFGGYQSRGAQGLSGRTDHRYGGVVVGADTAPTGNALFGAFGGYAYSSLAFEDLSLNKTGAENIETHALFAGVFGRIESAFGQNGGGLFADGTLTLGYADGNPGTRLQANNLVTGGIEEITGGDASGVYADTSITFGANVPIGASGAMLIPSATLAYATQWRKGYTENNAAIGGMDVDGHQVSVLSGRLQLAAQMSGTTASGLLWTAAIRGGVNAQQDMSEKVSFTMLSTAFDTQTAEDDLNIGGLVGANFTFAHSDILAFTLDSEMTFAGPASNQVGGTLNAGLRARF